MSAINSGEIDLAVVGAGPAGLAAATTAAELGLAVSVFDENATPGGQIYRGIEAVAAKRGADFAVLGDAYRAGESIVRDFRASKAAYAPNTGVWLVQKDRQLGIVRDGKAGMVAARRVLIATGAQERPVPIPGWTLPGVMLAGAAQGLLKSAGMVPAGPVVLAGNGPLLYQLAAQLVAAGVKIAALLETRSERAAALPHLPAALMAGNYLAKGLGLIAAVKRAGVPIRRGVTELRALGCERLEAVEVAAGGRTERIDAALLCLHQGVVANVQLSLAIPLKHEWSAAQRCWRPVVDQWGNSDVEGIAVAGDCAGIGGAEAAAHAGRIAAFEAARALGRIDAAARDTHAASDLAAWRRHLRARPFLDALYPPAQGLVVPADDVPVCRCEEVTAGQVRDAVRQGGTGPNQVKSFTRSGMGPCQGRMCALTVSEVIADALGKPVAEIGTYRIRPPIKPLTVGELAALE
ncbi:MAG: NAD(P)/FAD-dependent oxidoreductase [Alphaproteobacteria bacterium]|nr:NAD(P)/FAD-dependent oxidoreductase [Alphaproteobacteria bacterium]